MKNPGSKQSVGRRTFMKGGLVAGAAAALGAGASIAGSSAQAQEYGRLNPGDTAILRFLAAAELIEADLWTQYAELGGLTSGIPVEVNMNQQMNAYQAALSNLDTDGPQYITSNTLDEVSHANFLNAYLESRGAAPVNFDGFRTLPGSTATGSSGKKRLTNLMHLNVDTSWFVRYRSATNPDFGATFPQAITLTNQTAIPITNADFKNANHIQAIANVAAFHFGAIEQGGTSLYAAMSQKVSDPEVLRITLGIGGDEIAHFLEWVDFAGNGVQPTVAPFTDPQTGLTFPNFFNPPNPSIQPSLIFPVPCEFINPNLPKVSVIRPITDKFAGAVAAAEGLIESGLFIGQSNQFLSTLRALAAEADAAIRIAI
jgi:Ferritin-like domain/TAT (twin-arginine translocation) pathway signal sequence